MIRFCLVGAGFIGPLHAANIVACPDAELAWVVDLDAAAGKALSQKYGARTTPNLGEAMADARVDVDGVVGAVPAPRAGELPDGQRLAGDRVEGPRAAKDLVEPHAGSRAPATW